MTPNQIGKIGEKTFETWCAQAGLISNQSLDDQTGWDFYVEFQNKKLVEAHDQAPQCKVQVKTTSTDKDYVQVTLSNLQRLATDHLPAFFIFIRLNELGDVIQGYIVHVGKELMKSILEKVHKSDGNSLNLQSMNVRFSKDNEFDIRSANTLKEVIEEYIGSDFREYVKKKQDYCKSVGFEGGRNHLSVKLSGKQAILDLIDVSIGKRELFKAIDSTLSSLRFGVKSNTRDMGECFISMPNLKPTVSGNLKLKCKGAFSRIVVPADIYVSPLLDKEESYYRIDAGFFEFTVSKNQKKVNIFDVSFDFNKRFKTINITQNVLRFLDGFAAEQAKLSVVTNDGKAFMSGEVVEFFCGISLSILRDTAKIISEILDVAECNYKPEFSICDVEDFVKKSDYYRTMLFNTNSYWRVSFDLDSTIEDGLIDREWHCLITSRTKLGSGYIFAMAVVSGLPKELKEGRYQVNSDKVEVLFFSIEERLSDTITREISKVRDDYELRMDNEVFVDLSNMILIE
ncbi:DUF4365 domain-containing protein [Shewanella algae]|uniref:DUF4365 domain-containing protein n=1 Tax=Shewanella algae TaxID=38313 RepID=UPI0011842E1C|nr:DUF4365 domain-containing protein [Shewanella algae]TVL06323.1 hypothetical protein AYI82_15670 [Shewanella algae]